jgi:phosphomannomutase
MVRHALVAGLTASGCPVLDCGVCPTPSVLLAVSRRQAGGGILVTASHNPIEWNALKFVGGDGFFLGPAEGAELASRFRSGEPSFVRYDEIGDVAPGPDVVGEHLEAVLRLPWIDAARVRARKWRVALDAVGGAGAALALALLDRLGCRVEPLYTDPTGSFPRPPEPTPENLGDLCGLVRETGADVGFALDPDGDRLSLVAEGGLPLSEERTVTLAADFVLARNPGPVVVNLSTTAAVEDLAARYGVSCLRTPVGEAHVAAAMRSSGAVVGGEGNGGVMVPALHPMRDAAVGMALLLQAMTDSSARIGAIDARLPQSVLLKRVLRAETVDGGSLEGALRARFGEGLADRRDGIRLAWGRRWVHVRSSNTEPVVRVLAEAPDREGAEELQGAVAGALAL